ncbi:hypothetical protein GCM10010376_79490 [Streptomyces violaceusniger]
MVLAFPRAFRGDILDPLTLVGLGARLIETATMPEAEVRQLLEERTDVGSAIRLAHRVHAITGGNPSLVTALAHDLVQAGGPPRPGDPVPVGEGFRTAYLGGLVRHPHLAACVEALAVLGDNADPGRTARLLNQSPEVTRTHLEELEGAGLLDGGAFRHQAVPGFVLGSMDGTRLRRLHLRAGEILLYDGAPATVVARYLVIADDTPSVSQVRVLWHASRQLLVTGHVEEAVACLRLADRADIDGWCRNEVAIALIGTLQWVNPVAAEPEVRRLLAAARKGQVRCCALRLLLAWFLWYDCNWRDPAQELLARIAELCGPGHDHSDMERNFQVLVGFMRPELLGDPALFAASSGAQSGGHRPHQRESPASSPADPTLQHGEPTDYSRSLERGLVAILRLVWEGEMKLADRACAELPDRVPLSGLPAGHAFLAGLHAHVRWSLGDLRTALANAASALNLLPDHSWGIAIGLPLSVLINVHTMLGEVDRAADYLDRPLPAGMQGSFFGALYHMAHGRWLLSTGQASAALEAFLSCPPACKPPHTRGFDLLGWRASAAEAYLALGEFEEARDMARAEIAALGTEPADARGRALTVLAQVDAQERRRAHLEEAERALRPTGSRLSLAGVLTRLSRLDLAEGNTAEARARRNEALDLSHQCGVPEESLDLWPLTSPLPTGLRPLQSVTLDEIVFQQSGGPASSNLSEAEWRVASLAAEGKSNRQIAKKLYVTVSTVEQHLTRVYRKLKVRRRSDLSDLLLSSR